MTAIDETRKRLIIIVLKKIVGRVISKDKNQVRDCFGRWRFKTEVGQKALVSKMNQNLKDYEMDFVAKAGALNIIEMSLRSAITVNTRSSFEKIKFYSFSVS